MTRYRYFLLSSVLQFPYSFNVQQYRFFFAPPPPSPRLCPHFAALHRKSCRRSCVEWESTTSRRCNQSLSSTLPRLGLVNVCLCVQVLCRGAAVVLRRRRTSHSSSRRTLSTLAASAFNRSTSQVHAQYTRQYTLAQWLM